MTSRWLWRTLLVEVHMPAGRPSNFVLSDEQIAEILETRKSVKKTDPKWDQRLRGILLVGRDGLSRRAAAEFCEVDERSIYTWQNRFLESGASGLKDLPRSGRIRRLAPDQLAALADIVRAGPEASGLDTGVWTTAKIVSVVQDKFGVTYSPSQIGRLLKELRFSFQVPKTRLAKANEELRRQWKETTLPTLIERAQGGDCVLFF
jgi:transposase